MRIMFLIIVQPLFAFLLNGCAAMQPDLWPPAAGVRSYPIYVSLDTWHGMIGFPPELEVKSPVRNAQPEKTAAAAREPKGPYEEWGYAEFQWYVKERQGFTGIVRALLWPSAGTVEVARYDRLWASRTPQPPADLFVFHLSHEGLLRLHRHLLSTVDGADPLAKEGRSVFYPSRRSYHLFHHCHQYVAHALREAGLPISPGWALSRRLLAIQLRRAEGIAEEQTPEPARIESR